MSDLLIKGMEMPKNCGECLLAKLSPTGESLICNYMLSRVSWEERPFDCPLVSVPPHGDLIDADKLVELCDIMAYKCDGIGASIWHQFKTTVEWSPIVIPAEEDE